MTDVLNPTNDYVFKRLFADVPELLVSLMDDLRPQAPPLAQLCVLNPEIPPSEIQGKLIRLDVLAKDEHGGQYNVEIQGYRYQHWHQRGLFYLSRLMASQLRAGVPYKALQANVGMHLLDFDLFTATDAERAQVSIEKVRALSQDEREWAQAWARDKALRDEISMRDQERSEGRAEGKTTEPSEVRW